MAWGRGPAQLKAKLRGLNYIAKKCVFLRGASGGKLPPGLFFPDVQKNDRRDARSLEL